MSAFDDTPGRIAPRRFRATLSRRFSDWPSRIALVALGAVVLVALVGPIFAPHSPAEIVGSPYAPPSSAFPLGTDYTGEDVLSRVLWGGRTVLAYAILATLGAYLLGGTVGLIAGYTRSIADPVLMRTMDVLLAFPPILFLLLLAAGAGPSATALVLGIAIVQAPSVTRIVRTAALETSTRSFVEAAIARGDTMPQILRREILPSLKGVLAADVGPRFTVSILLVAALNFLGLGTSPPAADWAVMISENRAGINLQPWALVAPAIMITILTVSVNIVADALVRSSGGSVSAETYRR